MRDRSGFDFDGHGEADRGSRRLGAGRPARLHRREPRLRQHRHRGPAGAEPARLAAGARERRRRTSTTPRSPQRTATASRTPAPATSTTTRTRRATTDWRFDFNCLTSTSSSLMARHGPGAPAHLRPDRRRRVQDRLRLRRRSTTATERSARAFRAAPPQESAERSGKAGDHRTGGAALSIALQQARRRAPAARVRARGPLRSCRRRG